MGTRLSLVAVVGGLLVAGSASAQQRTPTPAPQPAPQAGPGPLPAADFAKQGTDLYNAGNYAGAVTPLKRAHEMEPNNFEYRFMLAQALRQSGNCGEAVPHYKALSTSAPPERAAEVKSAMDQCPSATITPQPATPAPVAPPPSEKVVVHSSRGGLSTSDGALLIGAGLGIGGGAALFLAAMMDDDDADAAARYEDHQRISNRADTLRVAAAVSAGAGVVLGVIGILRVRAASKETELAISPRKGGGMLVLERSW